MEIIAIACIVLIFQSLLGFMQINYYRRYMRTITEKYLNCKDYYLYSSMERKHFGSSAIAVIVVDKNNVVKECQVLQGKSVFAKFKLLSQFHEKHLLKILEQFEKDKISRKLFVWEEAIIKTANSKLLS